ncbi:Conserved hypothetical protein [Shewanella piezotolerans WP3]|uniref:YdhG-like domain-containing protein n=2 Tax=Shewanella TaxID=22 RepID=B8CPM5_SHEPW|nr:Conserved hypothetical protein [Shewanella piezotolerans WP3]
MVAATLIKDIGIAMVINRVRVMMAESVNTAKRKDQPVKSKSLKTQPNSVDACLFLKQKLEGQKLEDCQTLHKLYSTLTKQPAVMWGSIIGFGQYHYRYASGREGDWPLTGFAARKNDITLYFMNGFGDYQDILPKLGKHKTGKSCLYIKRLSEVDLAVLTELITDSIVKMKERYPK